VQYPTNGIVELPVRERDTSLQVVPMCSRQPLWGQQAHLYCETNDITARSKPELIGNARSIRLNGFHADQKLRGYLLTAIALRHELQHLLLTVAEDVSLPYGTDFPISLLEHVLDKNACQTRVYENPASVYRSDCRKQF